MLISNFHTIQRRLYECLIVYRKRSSITQVWQIFSGACAYFQPMRSNATNFKLPHFSETLADMYVYQQERQLAQLHRSGKYFQEHAYFQPFFSNASNVITHPQRRVIWGELWKCTLLISLGKYSQELWHIFSHELQEFNWVVRVQMACSCMDSNGYEPLGAFTSHHLPRCGKQAKERSPRLTALA